MTDYTIGTNEQGKKVLYTHHKADGENFGDYVEVPEGSSFEYAEHVYRNVWKTAKAFCEKAGAGLHRIQMIVKLMRCDKKIRKEEGLPYLDVTSPPVMTIGWTLYLTNEEKARLSKEDIASIAGGIFVEEEKLQQSRCNGFERRAEIREIKSVRRSGGATETAASAMCSALSSISTTAVRSSARESWMTACTSWPSVSQPRKPGTWTPIARRNTRSANIVAS